MGKPKRSIGRRVAKIIAGLVVGCALAEAAFHLRDGGAFPHVSIYVPDEALGTRHATGYERRAHRGAPLAWRMGAQGPFLTD